MGVDLQPMLTVLPSLGAYISQASQPPRRRAFVHPAGQADSPAQQSQRQALFWFSCMFLTKVCTREVHRDSIRAASSNRRPAWPRPPVATMDRTRSHLGISHPAAHSPVTESQVHVVFVSHYVSSLGGEALKSGSFVLTIAEEHHACSD
jgi:hypothetical protein